MESREGQYKKEVKVYIIIQGNSKLTNKLPQLLIMEVWNLLFPLSPMWLLE